MSPANQYHYAMRLNNFFQRRYGASAHKRHQYKDTSSGPQYHLLWEGTYSIDGIKYGVGKGSNKKDVKEAAAEETIRLLAQERVFVP
ncbi:hypothetical protein K503DRAFT_799474 [Rhizopogon vinicolor AM-OR11-026]|uniref:DRBM domain-containing protein n=1 Tax=Rhizopogon vinicolor AM-OR11-026 TaxID=1314800 RepID=A0A1B7N478_9AGAM|nr:hypothetical protein K503DRAFT_799474 [Rhizopogon vinicolor AM-OR11-026]